MAFFNANALLLSWLINFSLRYFSRRVQNINFNNWFKYYKLFEYKIKVFKDGLDNMVINCHKYLSFCWKLVYFYSRHFQRFFQVRLVHFCWLMNMKFFSTNQINFNYIYYFPNFYSYMFQNVVKGNLFVTNIIF